MKLLSTVAIVAGVAPAALGIGLQAQAQVVLSMQQTDCAQLFSTDPTITELAVPPVKGNPVDGVTDDGNLAVNVTITRGTRTEPTTLDWESIPSVLGGRAAAQPVQAILVQVGSGNTIAYLHPTGALFGSGLAGPVEASKTITRARFCYGGTKPELASLAACPLSAVAPEGDISPLQNACDVLAPAAYFMFVFPRGSDLGPRDREGPALCVCETGVVETPDRIITTRSCDISDRSAPDACFPLPTAETPGRRAFATNVDEFVRAAGSTCAIQCTTIDGLRFCTEFCLSTLGGGG